MNNRSNVTECILGFFRSILLYWWKPNIDQKLMHRINRVWIRWNKMHTLSIISHTIDIFDHLLVNVLIFFNRWPHIIVYIWSAAPTTSVIHCVISSAIYQFTLAINLHFFFPPSASYVSPNDIPYNWKTASANRKNLLFGVGNFINRNWKR